MKKIKIVISAMVMTVFATVFNFTPAMAAVTCPEGTLRAGDTSVDSLAQCNVPKTEDDTATNGKPLMEVVQTVINVALSILGIVTVIMIILGGVQYTTSQGDATKATKARNTILYGVIGLVIALLAYAIVNFVLKEVFNPTDGTKTEVEVEKPGEKKGAEVKK